MQQSHGLGAVGGFFFQFARGAHGRILAGIKLAGGQFEQGLAGSISPLAHQHHFVCFGNGQHTGGAGVADNDAVALVAVGQSHSIAGNGNEFAVENRLGRELGFGEVHGSGVRLPENFR